MATSPQGSRVHRHDTCNDQVVGAILSGWRYDISGIPPDLRGDYEAHLRGCTGGGSGFIARWTFCC